MCSRGPHAAIEVLGDDADQYPELHNLALYNRGSAGVFSHSRDRIRLGSRRGNVARARSWRPRVGPASARSRVPGESSARRRWRPRCPSGRRGPGRHRLRCDRTGPTRLPRCGPWTNPSTSLRRRPPSTRSTPPSRSTSPGTSGTVSRPAPRSARSRPLSRCPPLDARPRGASRVAVGGRDGDDRTLLAGARAADRVAMETAAQRVRATLRGGGWDAVLGVDISLAMADGRLDDAEGLIDEASALASPDSALTGCSNTRPASSPICGGLPTAPLADSRPRMIHVNPSWEASPPERP